MPETRTDVATAAPEPASCKDSRCGHWLVLGPPQGSGGTRVDLFGHVAKSLPPEAMLVFGSGVPAGLTVSPGAWLVHVPHDWTAPDDDYEEDEEDEGDEEARVATSPHERPADAVTLAGEDGLRMCCCPGHLDGLTLDEMADIGAPCPTHAYLTHQQTTAKAIGWEIGYQRATQDSERDLERADNPFLDEDEVPGQ